MSRSIGLKSFKFVLSGAIQPLSLVHQYCFNFEIHAETTNTGWVYTGDSGVTTADGRPITPGMFFSAPDVKLGGHSDEYDLNKVYVLGTADEIIRVLYATYID
jgi:hypothetical protein